MKNKDIQIKKIPIKKIKIATFANRKWKDPEKFNELCASVKKKGVIFPILVRKIDKEFDLIKGSRRLQAAQLAGLKNIPAIIRETTNQELLLMRLDTGLNQEEQSVFDEGLLFAELLQPSDHSQGMRIGELSKIRKKSDVFITDRIKLLSLCDYVQEKVFNQTLPLKQAVLISEYSREEAKQKEYADLVIHHGLTASELAAKVGKSTRERRRKGIEKSTGLKLVTQMKGALNLLLAVNENIDRYDLRELQMMEKVNDEIFETTKEIRKKINARKVV